MRWFWPFQSGSKPTPEKPTGTFVMEGEWDRTEELRPDRLGPSEDDLDEAELERWCEQDPWRPKRTLGPF